MRSRTSRVRLGLSLLCSLLLALAGCSPLRVLNGVVPDDASNTTLGVAYGEDARQKVDVYAPLGVRDAPVVVFFYGGSWSGGSRADYKFVGDALRSQGIVAVIADYRLYPQVSYPDFLDDSARALAWALAHAGEYGGDPHRVFVAGHSAGAYNAAMMALDGRWLARYGANPRQLAGWIGISGPYNFLPIQDEEVKKVFHFPGTPLDTQPIAHAGADAPPTLLLTGGSDTTVDPSLNTGRLAAALRSAGAPLQEAIYPGKGHAIMVGAFARPLRWTVPVLERVAGFVRAPPVRKIAARQ
jgi:acetyl esterase/lipase